MFEDIVYSVQTGSPGFDKIQGMPLFEYLSRHPDDLRLFNELMVGFHGPETDAVASSYDFSRFDTIVDVGGATGNMLAAILTRHHRPRGYCTICQMLCLQRPLCYKPKGS
jgi:O-methyltransferase domain